MSSPEEGYQGHLRPDHTASRFNAQAFIIQSMIDRVSTLLPCKVMGVTNSGAVDAVGFVDLLPLVNQLDGDGNATPYTDPIYHCPVFRLQGGGNAIILDPQVGDIGVALFAERDISSVIANKGQANPGTARRFDKSDALYLGGYLNGTPDQYGRFSTTGIEIHSPTQVKLTAPDIRIDADTVEINAQTVTVAATTSTTVTTPTFTINGALVTTGNITGGANVTAATNVSDSIGSMTAIRTAYNAHKGHGTPGTGNVPDHPM